MSRQNESEPTRIQIQGYEALQREVGRSKIIDAAFAHLESQRRPTHSGGGFTLDFGLDFTLFGLL
jgi:hypothetical protein